MQAQEIPISTVDTTKQTAHLAPKPQSKKSIIRFVLGFLLLLTIFGILGLGFYLLSRNSLNVPTPSNTRSVGKSKVTETNEIDTPTYDESIKGAELGIKGGVISSTLKNGIPVHLVIPADSLELQYVEISEFKQMPTSSTHVALYDDYGFGLNVSFEKVQHNLDIPAYLVFDFSKGRKLEEYKRLTKNANFCDFSTKEFNPSACSSMLNVPITNTLNKKYFAVSPYYADDGRTPTFPIYSYYLGNDDILVLQITNSVVVIPQPLNKEVVSDVISSTFRKYSTNFEENEGYDLMRHFDLDFNDKELLGNITSRHYPTEIKTFNSSAYINQLYKKAVQKGLIDPVGQISPEAATKSLLGLVSPLENTFKYISIGVADHHIVSSISDLRRAYDSRLVGSAKLALKYLKAIEQNIKDDLYSVDERPVALQAEGILLGKLKFSSKILGDVTDAETAARTEFEQEASRIATNWEQNVSNYSDANFEDASDVAQTLTEWLEIVQSLGGDPEYAEKLAEGIKKAVEDMVKAALSDDEILKAADACKIVLGDSRCNDIEKKAKAIKVKLCEAEVTSKNLSNFAKQTELEKCKDI